ncbi:hypothetical protein CcCBS67573_g09864 [Chytriomyces confervae]|uniref:Uncharacterized protein n=1 Tax=Chytriomyces confervae TaxID=246404 RepID=A0A507DLC5_9FUNG|nr:hypothetical protein CcCBS67573_g09864 [Chytriomyces confervae]
MGDLSIQANGLKVTNVPVMCSSDETSGNTTKRYNHFENFFVMFPSLPHKFYGPGYINFAATTNTGSWSDIAEVVLHDLRHGNITLFIVFDIVELKKYQGVLSLVESKYLIQILEKTLSLFHSCLQCWWITLVLPKYAIKLEQKVISTVEFALHPLEVYPRACNFIHIDGWLKQSKYCLEWHK